MMKWLRLGLLLGSSASAVGAVDWSALKLQGYVSDFAGAVDAGSKNQLEAYCGNVERSTGAQMRMVILPSLESEPVQDVANVLYRAWGVGQKSKNEGILLLLAVQERRSAIAIGTGLEPLLSRGSILREMRPALKQLHYGEALMAAAETFGQTVAQAKKVSLKGGLQRRIRWTSSDWIPLPMLAGAVALVVWLMRAGGLRGYGDSGGAGFLPGLVSGRTLARATWGSNGSGGFGGYDSGDGGFGGFGGGDSPHSGASDW